MIETVAMLNAASEPASSHLISLQGALLELRILVDPRLLEELIEALAALNFPVNPQLLHHPEVVHIEFSAYANHLTEVREQLSEAGFDPASVEVRRAIFSPAGAGN